MDKVGEKMKNAVIFGAGQTGRGYVTRYLVEKEVAISFVEIDPDLIKRINEDKFFSIHFYRKDRTPVSVQNIKAYSTEESLKEILENADIIFTAVGEQNLKAVAETIKKNWPGEKKLPQLLTCENGINPGKVLYEALVTEFKADLDFKVSQTAVFCSTVNLKETRLDILSQNMTHFPYDIDHFEGKLNFSGEEEVHDFEKYLKRKIYTYNCFAGIISYLGYLKGYELFNDAANDAEILTAIELLQETLNPSLAKYFDISLAEQQDFSDKAMIKFKDRSIIDYSVKNGRAPKRKLGKTERIYAPYEIIRENDMNTDLLPLVAAAALVYWEELQNISEPPIPKDYRKMLAELLELSENDSYIETTLDFYQKIIENREEVKILKLLDARRGETAD